MKAIATILLLLVIAVATAATPESPPAEAKPPPSTADIAAFGRGARAWADNCVRCHAMRDPKSLNDAQWTAVVAHMRLRAGLDGQVARDITLFLKASN